MEAMARNTEVDTLAVIEAIVAAEYNEMGDRAFDQVSRLDFITKNKDGVTVEATDLTWDHVEAVVTAFAALQGIDKATRIADQATDALLADRNQ